MFSCRQVTGPTRYGWDARTKAEADLAQARQASTREEMQQSLRDMHVASGRPAALSVAVGLPEQAPAAPSMGVALAAPSVAVVPKAVSGLGSVYRNGKGWRVQVCFRRDVVVYGPTHKG